ncbi:hypothetical protein LTR66_017830 [Elasticomyces elasticus]|nr:hypothetical protein LTR66_017830 [Elasticomyces elasticus]
MADPEMIAEYITTKQSLPKSPLETGYMNKFLGDNNLVSIEGHHWKSLRSMFNPGFSAQNVLTLTDTIVDASLKFCDVLRAKAKTNEHFQFEEYATRLTIDIIGRATFDVDMDAQQRIHPIVKHFRERVELMPPGDAVFPWQAIDVFRPLKLWLNNRKLEAEVKKELDEKIVRRAKDIEDELKNGVKQNKKRSIVDLALNAYEKEQSLSPEAGGNVKHILEPSELPRSLRQDIADSVKTFFFAGHDTTTIAWAHYLLHRNTEPRRKLMDELNHFFPPGTSAADTIKADPHIVNQLEYTTAFIKETMRIFPPASTLRSNIPGQPIAQTVMRSPSTGQEYPIFAGIHIWPAAHLVHRNRRFFPRPTHFIPERFLRSQTPFPEAELFTPAGKEAFRPFERGPRNCIGQELAMAGTKIILALTAREFDFVLEYPGEQVDPQHPIPNSTAEEFGEMTAYGGMLHEGRVQRYRVEGHRCWPFLKGTAKPTGGLPGRVYLRKDEVL